MILIIHLTLFLHQKPFLDLPIDPSLELALQCNDLYSLVVNLLFFGLVFLDCVKEGNWSTQNKPTWTWGENAMNSTQKGYRPSRPGKLVQEQCYPLCHHASKNMMMIMMIIICKCIIILKCVQPCRLVLYKEIVVSMTRTQILIITSNCTRFTPSWQSFLLAYSI